MSKAPSPVSVKAEAPGSSSTLDADTLSPGSGAKLDQLLQRSPTLTIAYHPNAQRIGEQAVLRKIDASTWGTDVSRLAPDFADTGGRLVGPLRHRFVSRTPVSLTVTHEEVQVSAEQAIKVGGVAMTGKQVLPATILEEGMVIELSGGVIVVLKLQRPASPPRFNLSGLSDAVALIKDEIARVGPQDNSVLILGETGVGKELIARALHECSRRAQRPFIAVNMGAIPKETAVAELFGYKKGAFTGATSDQPGHFGMAEGGSLFLDEIGETPDAVQPVLLRALENMEVQPLGAAKIRSIDIRLIAATDANLEQLMEEGGFKRALFHRLGGYQLKVPPLRERKEDIAPLFVEFLQQELTKMGKGSLLEERDEPWLRGRIVAQLLHHDWPGNVRELRNVASQIAAFSAGLSRSEMPPALVNLGKPGAGPSDHPTKRTSGEFGRVQKDPDQTTPPPQEMDRARPSEISDEQLLAALKANGWRVAATARALGIAKNSLYELIDRCPKIRTARDISKEEISSALARHEGDVEAMASELQVSLRALQLRMKELGLR